MLTPTTTDRCDPLRRVRFDRADCTWTAVYGDHIVKDGCTRHSEAEQALDEYPYAYLRHHHVLPVTDADAPEAQAEETPDVLPHDCTEQAPDLSDHTMLREQLCLDHANREVSVTLKG